MLMVTINNISDDSHGRAKLLLTYFHLAVLNAFSLKQTFILWIKYHRSFPMNRLIIVKNYRM